MEMARNDKATVTVAIWKRTDIVLNAKNTYQNPYYDVDIYAVFTHADGTEIRLEGFWNGADEWRVRFSPTKVGVWEYEITSNQPSDSGLCNSGSILAVKNEGDTRIDRHGFIEISDNKRYFQHADGTPFYWLGDTQWQAPNLVYTTCCNYPGCNCQNQFKHEVDNRLSKDFSVYQTYFNSNQTHEMVAYRDQDIYMWSLNATRTEDKENSSLKCLEYDLGDKKTVSIVEIYTKRERAGKELSVAVYYDTGDGEVCEAREWTRAYFGAVSFGSNGMLSIGLDAIESRYIKIEILSGEGSVWEYEACFFEHEAECVDLIKNSFGLRDNLFKRVNPYFFSHKVDSMFDYLADNGIVIALGVGVHKATPMSMSQEDMIRIGRYVTARYASYPLVWILGQEINVDNEELFLKWVRTAEDMSRRDGYHHPFGTHLNPGDIDDPHGMAVLQKAPWHEWWGHQTGHVDIVSKKRYQGYWNSGKPFLETESWYEDIFCGGFFNGYKNARISAWKANFCGSYGFTYGCVGIWANRYSTADNDPLSRIYNMEPWYMGLDKPASYEMTYLKNFFEYARFNTLVPRFNDSAYSDFTIEEKLVSSSDDKSIYAAYFYNDDLSTGKLCGLNKNGKYTARWYDPLTGGFLNIGNAEISENGEYAIPQKPTIGDWAILVTSIDLGEYTFKSGNLECCGYVSKHSFANFDGEKQEISVIDCVGGAIYYQDGTFADTKNFLTDGDYNTCWKPFDSRMAHTIVMDIHSVKSLQGIIITLGENAYLPEYRIYGSKDGCDWTVLADATIREASCVEVEERKSVREALCGEYRFIKLLWLNSSTDDEVKAIAEIEIFAKA